MSNASTDNAMTREQEVLQLLTERGEKMTVTDIARALPH